MRPSVTNSVLCSALITGTVLVWILLAESAPLPVPVYPSPGMRMDTGVQQSYDVDVRSRVDIADATGERGWQHVLRGRLTVQVADAGHGDRRLACRLLDPVQEVDGTPCPDPMLGSLFTVAVEATGRFGAFEFTQNVPQASRGQLREMMRLFHVVVPAGATDSWRDEEVAEHGRCETLYRRADDRPDGSGVSRRRLAYRSDGDRRVRILESNARFELAVAGAWLRSAEVRESIEVRGSMAQVVRAQTHGTLRWSDQEFAAPLVIATAMRDSATEVLLTQARQQATAVAAVSPATAADRQHFLDLLSQLDGVERPGALLDALRDAMLAHPDLCSMVAEELLDPTKHTDLTASTLIHAMKMAGHSAAQDALAGLALDPRLAQQNRIRATIDLGGVEAATAETRDRLWQLSAAGFDARSSELATTATLALGRIGHAMREAGDPDYALLRGRLQESLLAARGDDDGRAALLTAAGNTADPELRPAVASAMESSNPRLRAAAAKALGRIPDSQSVLLQGLAEDPNPRVRGQIAKGLLGQGQLGTAPLRIVAHRILTETDEGARYAMARLLGENDPGDGTSTGALRNLMQTEPSKRIRQYVAGRLARDR